MRKVLRLAANGGSARGAWPSGIETSATGRVGTPDEFAAVAAFLLDHEAGFITGSPRRA